MLFRLRWRRDEQHSRAGLHGFFRRGSHGVALRGGHDERHAVGRGHGLSAVPGPAHGLHHFAHFGHAHGTSVSGGKGLPFIETDGPVAACVYDVEGVAAEIRSCGGKFLPGELLVVIRVHLVESVLGVGGPDGHAVPGARHGQSWHGGTGKRENEGRSPGSSDMHECTS